MKVLVGGASGFIGSALRRSLQRKGHEVTSVSRRPAPSTVTWDQIRETGLPQCDAVVNLAGEPIMGSTMRRWTSQFETDLMSSRIGTNEILVEAILKSSQPPNVFVSSSAIGYYTHDDTTKYDEDSICSNSSFTHKLCHKWEKSAKIVSEAGVRLVTIRIGLVLGKCGGTFKNLKWPFLFGLGGTVGSGRQLFPWVHLDDTVGIYEHAIECESVCGVLNAVAPGIVTNYEFTKALGRAMNRPTVFGVPAFVIRMMLHQERAMLLLQGTNIVPRRTIELGYKFKYPDIESATAELVQ